VESSSNILKYSSSVTISYKLYIVKTETVYIREEMNASSASFGILHSGQYIIGTSQSEDWIQFGRGYVNTSSLVEVKGSSGCHATCDIISRDGPSISYSEIASVQMGTEIIYYGEDPESSDWCITDAGYIEKEKLQCNS